MGLDVFCYGGCSVRLLVQGCLILWLGLFSASSFAVEYSYTYSDEALAACQNTNSSGDYTLDCAHKSNKFGGGGQYELLASYGTYFYFKYSTFRECSEQWGHQPDPITGEIPEPGPCTCETGWVDAGEGMLPRCIVDRDQEAEECYENGQIYDNSLGYCVLDCPNGQLNGVCLQDISDNADDCSTDHPDYQGYIGNGNTRQNICSSSSQCGDGGTLGFVNNSLQCVPDEYNPPECSGSEVLVVDEFGSWCNPLEGTPESDPEPDPAPNTDTDGDGIPDEYQRGNDPDAVNEGLDNVSEGVSETNDQLKDTNKRLGDIGKGISEVNKNLNEGLGSLNDTLGEMNEGMQSPEGGFNPDGFGGLVPTFSETASDFSQSISAIPAVSAVTGLADLPESLTCPVYTIPATPISGPVALDIHCQVFNDYRGVISALFLFFWTGTALFIFLRA